MDSQLNVEIMNMSNKLCDFIIIHARCINNQTAMSRILMEEFGYWSLKVKPCYICNYSQFLDICTEGCPSFGVKLLEPAVPTGQNVTLELIQQPNVTSSVASESDKNLNQTEQESILQPVTTKPTSSSKKSEQLAYQTFPIKLGIPIPVHCNTGLTIIKTLQSQLQNDIDDSHFSNTGKTISQDVLQSQSQSQSQQKDIDIVPAVNPIINVFLSKRQVIHDCQLRSHQSAPWIAELAVDEDLKPGTKVKCLEVTSNFFHFTKNDIYEVYCGRYLMLIGHMSTYNAILTNLVGHLAIGKCQLAHTMAYLGMEQLQLCDAPIQNYCNKMHDFATLEGVSLQPNGKNRIQLSCTDMNKATKCTFERHAIIVQTMFHHIVIASAYLVRHIFLSNGEQFLETFLGTRLSAQLLLDGHSTVT
jgi:hypothetical protein